MTLLLCLLAGQDPTRELPQLIEQLRADRIEDREAAVKRIKVHGERALPGLREAARSSDAELSVRAARLLRVVEIRVRLTDGLLRAFPDVDERLADGPAALWTAVLFEAVDNLRYPDLRREDLEALAVPALRHARAQDRERVVNAVRYRKLRSAVPALMEAMVDAPWSLFTTLVPALVELGQAEALLPRLLAMVRAPSDAAQRNGQWGLGRLPRELVAQPVRALLREEGADVRLIALAVLEDHRVAEAVPEILPLLDDPLAAVRAAAAKALGALDGRPAVGRLRELLGDPEFNVRCSAAGALGRLGAAEAAPEIARLLEEENPDVRARAAEALGALRVKEAVPALLKALDVEERGHVCVSVIEALAASDAKEAIPAIARRLQGSGADVAAAAARTLGRLGAQDRATDLLPLMKSSEWQVRWWAGHALVDLGVDEGLEAAVVLLCDPANQAGAPRLLAKWTTKERAPRVVPLLEHADPRVRAAAAQALEPHRGTASAVASRLDDPDPGVREQTLWSLLRNREDGLEPEVAARLKDASPRVRVAAARVLPYMAAKPDLKPLAPLLDDPDAQVRRAACDGLARLEGRPFAPEVRKRLSDPEDLVRIYAARCLAKMGEKDAAPDILLLLKDRNPVVRWHAAAALGELRAGAAVDELLRLLKDETANVRREAAEALGRIRDAKALEPLRALPEDEDAEVRAAVQRALKALERK